MIHLTRLNRDSLVLNSDLIEHIEVTPDTVIALTTGQKFLVLQSADEVIERVRLFRQSILNGISVCPLAADRGFSTSAGRARSNTAEVGEAV